MSVQTLTTPKERHDTTDHWGFVQGLYLGGNDDGIALRFFHGMEYEPQSRKLWRELCAGADAVVDVGAHTGIYSLDAWSSGAKLVISIEPYLVNYARLLMNLRHAGFPTDACVPFAAHDENGILEFGSREMNYYCSAGAHISTKKRGLYMLPVVAQRLDTLIKLEDHHRIKALKIDTEGNVGAVLKGMPHILSFTPDLILECIEDGLGDILKCFGYKFYRIHEQTGLHPVDDLTPDEQIDMQSPNRFASVRSF